MNEQGKPGISNRVWRAAATGRRGAVGMAAGLALALPSPVLAEQVVAPRAVLASSFDLGALPAAAAPGPVPPETQGGPVEALPPALDPDRLASEEDRRIRRQVHRMEIAYQILNAVDAAETIYCLDRRTCHELNPLLGRHPSTGKVLGFKAASGLIHYLTYRAIVKKNPRKARTFEYVSLVVQGGVVFWNLKACF